MKIQILSDLHLDHHADRGSEFIRTLAVAGDVLVLAGDVCNAGQLPIVLAKFCQKFPHVVFVHGNHEFYGFTRKQVIAWTEQACDENSNLSWLDNTSIEIDGVKFVGTPLWFKNEPLAPKWALNDFNMIRNYESWVYDENRKAIDFLLTNVDERSIVITHHMPSKRSVHPRYAGSGLNAFFLCDVEDPIITRQQPKLWIHGHTHSAARYTVGKTQVVCNPLGYPDENMRYDSGLCIEV